MESQTLDYRDQPDRIYWRRFITTTQLGPYATLPVHEEDSILTNLTKRRVYRLIQTVCVIFSRITGSNTNFRIGRRFRVERNIIHFYFNKNKEFMHKANKCFPLHLQN